MVSAARLLTRFCVTALFVVGCIGAPIEAQETLEGRIVGHVLPDDVKVIEVGDQPGHTVTLVRARGLAFLENGEVAELLATETLDNLRGEGTYEGYEILTFEDGSTIVSRFEGEDMLSEDGKYVDFEGTHEYVSGTGRFAGIKGESTHQGRNHLASGMGFYLSFSGTYTLGN